MSLATKERLPAKFRECLEAEEPAAEVFDIDSAIRNIHNYILYENNHILLIIIFSRIVYYRLDDFIDVTLDKTRVARGCHIFTASRESRRELVVFARRFARASSKHARQRIVAMQDGV